MHETVNIAHFRRKDRVGGMMKMLYNRNATTASTLRKDTCAPSAWTSIVAHPGMSGCL
jgi:hypothetical protein